MTGWKSIGAGIASRNFAVMTPPLSCTSNGPPGLLSIGRAIVLSRSFTQPRRSMMIAASMPGSGMGVPGSAIGLSGITLARMAMRRSSVLASSR